MAEFIDADLHGSRFQDVNLCDTSLARFNLARAGFDDGNMPDAVFHNVNLAGVKFENVNLSGTSVARFNLARAGFDDGAMPGAVFHNVNMAGVKFENVSLVSGEISNANLNGLHVRDCTFGNMRIEGILVEDLLACYRGAHP